MKKLIPLTSLLLLASLAVSAQDKLKDVQAAGLRAPAAVKVNGDLSEWNDSFQAYNKSTKLFYTMSNDDKNIYIAIKSTDAINNNKIAAGGITLTFNTDGKKKEKDAYTLTFPVVTRPTRNQRGQGGPGGPGGFGGGAGGNRVMMFGGPGGGAPVDSATIKAAHERTIAAAKEIKLFGFKDIPDSLISVYNEYGIKAAIGYDAKGNFTYEFALPVKLLNLSTDNPKEIAYNVKVNGLQLPNIMRMNDEGGGGPGGPGGGFGGPGGGGFGGGGGGRTMVVMGGRGGDGGGGPNTFQEMTSPSDFWGKYTLAKK